MRLSVSSEKDESQAAQQSNHVFLLPAIRLIRAIARSFSLFPLRFQRNENTSPVELRIVDKDSAERENICQAYLQVLHEVAEQLLQLDDETLVRSPPPPMPKLETSFWMSGLPQ